MQHQIHKRYDFLMYCMVIKTLKKKTEEAETLGKILTFHRNNSYKSSVHCSKTT